MCEAHGISLLEIPYSVESEELPEWISNAIKSMPESNRLTSRMCDWRSVEPTEWLASDSYSIDELAAFARDYLNKP